MTNITTLRHHAAHANTAEQRKVAEDLAREHLDDTMGLFPMQVATDLADAINKAGELARYGIGILCGFAAGCILTYMVLT